MTARKGLSLPIPSGTEAQTNAAPKAPRRSLEASAPNAVAGQLCLVHGSVSWPLSGSRLLVGRSGGGVDADIEIDDNRLSRRHAELVATRDGWQLRDLGSTNGTHVSGSALTAGEGCDVREGTLMSLGGVEVVLERR